MSAAAGRLRDRARGALLGAAAGDGLGAPFEGSRSVRSRDVARVESGRHVLRHTDDTAMLLVLAEQLLRSKRTADLDVDELVRAFARAWRDEPWRGYGASPPRIFELVEQGVPWAEAAVRFFDGRGSFGNGGAMRVAPVALATDDLSVVAALARRSAAVTHAHPLGQDGAVLQAVAVALALASEAGRPLDPHAFLDAAAAHLRERALVERLERARALLDGGTAVEAGGQLGSGIAALDSVPFAVLAFLRHPDSIEETIGFAICAGGDTDTTAAMAGAITGARVGASGLAGSVLSRVEAHGRLTALADALISRRSPGD
jgi:poly(ADP-ribose) glycohydrolase ARH3